MGSGDGEDDTQSALNTSKHIWTSGHLDIWTSGHLDIWIEDSDMDMKKEETRTTGSLLITQMEPTLEP
ncbi:hypothetical protein VP1G_11316 [Cytospora mali]|uniref:Uncharacterized protein n=1 Tax=Cytospora mali TaxID=578113 RepID=A0A194VCB9_CYTMA|nr:hypothetical protein VP1G_11316 [Valsa mali var. pyri (nom. inval.)]